MRLYKQLGELAYVKQRGQEATAYIRDDYTRFATLSLRRFIYYWAGLPHSADKDFLSLRNSAFLASTVLAFWGLALALRQRKPGAWLFFWLVLSFPLVYYIVFPHPRYRHPIEPELGILMVYVISEAESRRKRTNSRSGGVT